VIFLDTGAFLARYLANDQFHQQALRGWKKLQQERLPCFSSNVVLDETFTLLARHATYEFATARARNILLSSALTILQPLPEEELEAVDWLEKFADQKVSYTDCISFVLLRGKKIRRVFSFDVHFQSAGFTLWP
jgi:predicted nucleic acid-binding protein